MSENLRAALSPPILARGAAALSARASRFVQAEQGRFLPWLAVFIGVGNMLFFGQAMMPPAWIGPALLGPSALLLPLAWARLAPRALVLCLCAVSLGFAAASLRTHAMPPLVALPHRAVVVQGRVVAVEPLPQGRRVVLGAVSLDQGPRQLRQFRIRLRNNDTAAVAPGDWLRLRALLKPPFPPSYPGGWDQRRDAFFTGLGGLGFALAVATRLPRPPGHGWGQEGWGQEGWGQGWGHVWQSFWQSLREGVSARVLAAIPGPAGAVAATLLTGIRSAMPYTDRAAFSVTGLTHILAVAGLHIGIVMMTAFAAVRFGLASWPWLALRIRVKEVAAVAALLVGAFYMMMTGMHLPIMRSFVMASLVTLGLLAGRQAISMRSLALAAMLLLLVQPEALEGVSFQMSFSAVLVLIAGYDWLRLRRIALLAHRPGFWGFLRRDMTFITVTSFLAALATAPFSAYHFGQIEIYSIPANILAVPITAFWVLPCGLLAYALMPLHLAFLALVPMGWGCAAILGIARYGAALPGAIIATGAMPLFCLGLIGFGMAWLCLWGSRLRLWGLLPLLSGLALAPILGHGPQGLISPDFRMVALGDPGVVYLEAKRPDDFTLGEWARFWGGRPLHKLPAQGRVNGAICSPSGCLLPRPGMEPVLLWRAAVPPASCQGFSLIILENLWRAPKGKGCRLVPAITREAVWKEGAAAISFQPPRRVVIHFDRPERGDWPWLPAVGRAGR